MEDANDSKLEAARINAREAQYSKYVEWAERLVDRRAEANRFYVMMNMAIVGAMGFLFSDQFKDDNGYLDNVTVLIAIAVAGLVVSYIWHQILTSHRNILSAKFEVIHKLEQALPFRPYEEEWEIGQQKKVAGRILSTGKFERQLPIMFMLFYVIVLIMFGAVLVSRSFGVSLFDLLSGWLPGLFARSGG